MGAGEDDKQVLRGDEDDVIGAVVDGGSPQ